MFGYAPVDVAMSVLASATVLFALDRWEMGRQRANLKAHGWGDAPPDRTLGSYLLSIFVAVWRSAMLAPLILVLWRGDRSEARFAVLIVVIGLLVYSSYRLYERVKKLERTLAELSRRIRDNG